MKSPEPPAQRSAAPDYFRAFDDVMPPSLPAMSARRTLAWQVAAAFTLGLGAWYLHWRWTASLNPDAMAFSILIAAAETLMFFGALLYFFDTWEEGDAPRRAVPACPEELGLPPGAPPSVDIFIATFDEDCAVLRATLEDAVMVRIPDGWRAKIWLLDDGARPAVETLAREFGAAYLKRPDNRGFKAGNLRHALYRSDGEFIVICDADTRLFPGFLENTLGYFRDPDVAWVQTPHWFYDIPNGRAWSEFLWQTLAPLMTWLTGGERIGRDPFLSGSMLFFDGIQRRRNRHGASFCCGAGSIHRREPLFSGALAEHRRDRAAGARSDWACATTPLQPFRFHVSEDIYTSLLLHGSAGQRWRSVYHPAVESRMLSPWSMDAWAGQKLKYAGGTIEIMLRANPLWQRGMPWQIKLHYAATFWSYLSAFVLLILLAAPVFTLFTGLAPVAAYSTTFFLHLLPLLLANEAALVLGANGQDAHQGRVLSLATLPITMRAFWLVARGKRVRFKPTPKRPVFGDGLRFVLPHLAMIALMVFAAIYGAWAHLSGSKDHSLALLVVNYFWLGWCGLALARAVSAALWQPAVGEVKSIKSKSEMRHV
ncbi:MAG: glycosyltransferase [Pseudomonadota bacterium]